MDSFIDIGDVTTVTNTAYSSTPTYSVTAPNDKYVVVGEISIGIDSNFASVGKLQGKLNSKIFTSKNSSNSEISLIKDYAVPSPEKSFLFIEPQNTLEINTRVTSGTAKIQCSVSGVEVTRDEFMLLRKKYLGE
jgi:hypothetical protein